MAVHGCDIVLVAAPSAVRAVPEDGLLDERPPAAGGATAGSAGRPAGRPRP